MGLGLIDDGDDEITEELVEGHPTAGRLRLGTEIARGGMGVIFRAIDTTFDRAVAVKVLLNRHRDNGDLIRRFQNEARIAGQLQHPSIVPVFAMGTLADARPFYAMKLVEGKTLEEILVPDPGRPPGHDALLAIFQNIAQGVAYAHSRGVAHCDLKPSNVMVGKFGEVQVMDWGIAERLGVDPSRETAQEFSNRPTAPGTPGYMAPELFITPQPPRDERADVFALGSILCEILTGAPAYHGDSSKEVLERARRGEIAEAIDRLKTSAAAPELIALTCDCLAPERDDRPPNAGAVAMRIAHYREHVAERLRQAELAEVEARARASEERKRRRLQGVMAALTLALAMVVGVSYYAWEKRQRERESSAALVVRELSAIRDLAAADPSGDPGQWANAKATVARALPLIAEAPPLQRKLVSDLERDIEQHQKQAEADRALLDDLELARFRTHDFEFATALAMYKSAWQKANFDVWRGNPAEIGRAVFSRPLHVREAIVAGLDSWAIFASNLKNPDAAGEAPSHLAFRAAEAADPDPTRNAMRHAFASGDFPTIVALTRSVDPKRESTTSLSLMASMLLAGAQVAPATDLLRKARGAHPDDFWINNNLALVLSFRTNTADEALIYATVCVALRPTSATAHLRRAAIFDLKQNLAEAEPEYREALRLRPDYGPAHGRLAMMLAFSLGRHAEAVDEYRRAKALQPDRAVPLNRLMVHSLTQLKRFDEVVALHEEIARAAPRDAMPWLEIARVRIQQGDPASATIALERAAKLVKPGSPEEAQLTQETRARDRLTSQPAASKSTKE
jgi:serine/threonine-protein kinase